METPAWARLVDTFDPFEPAAKPSGASDGPSGARFWAVGALVRAVADALASRFNPVAVQGEISGFSRAASGHCYFSLKDDAGQLRCAMFRRAAEQVGFAVRDGQRVQVQGRLDVYGPRGDLQLIVESLRLAGQGSLYEQFLRLKAALQAEGLFDAERKRPLPVQPRHIGVVTSLGAAALRDVVTALRRRAPHIAVTVFPASVQGAQAPAELVAALATAAAHRGPRGACDVLLLVRGGGSLEDLWAFNDAAVVRAVAASPLPVVVGVGHETDFTLADFAADLRAPTPTAAAELCAPERRQRELELERVQSLMRRGVESALDQRAQRLDRLAAHLGRPSGRLARAAEQLTRSQGRLHKSLELALRRQTWRLEELQSRLPPAVHRGLHTSTLRLQRAENSLALLDPRLVLQRGYAYLTDAKGQAVTSVAQALPGAAVQATLADGVLPLRVREPGT
jgi:exodeoxyribonuclease VII large subunit